MKVKEKKTVIIELETWEYAELVDTLEMARQVRSKKYPLLNKNAAHLLLNMSGGIIHTPSTEPAGSIFRIDMTDAERKVAADLIKTKEEKNAKS